MSHAIAPELIDAAQLAETLLQPLGDRWLHTQAVAARATELAWTVPPADRDLLISAAWLHDIGYAPEVVNTGLHSLDGALFLTRQGQPTRLCALIAHHSGARFEASERGLTDALEQYELEDSAVIDALVAADLTTGPQGQPVSYSERINEILNRYPPDNAVHKAIRHADSTLRAQMQRIKSPSRGW